MKKIFLFLFLLFSSIISLSQTIHFENINEFKKYDTIYLELNNSSNKTLLCGTILTSSGSVLIAYSTISYINRIKNSDQLSNFEKESIETRFKNNLTLSCGFIFTGLIFDIIGLNQERNKIKCKDGKLILML